MNAPSAANAGSFRQNVLGLLWLGGVGLVFFWLEPECFMHFKTPPLGDVYGVIGPGVEQGLLAPVATRLAFKADFYALFCFVVFWLTFAWYGITARSHPGIKAIKDAAWRSRAELYSMNACLILLGLCGVFAGGNVLLQHDLWSYDLVEFDWADRRWVLGAPVVIPYLGTVSSLLLAVGVRQVFRLRAALGHKRRPAVDIADVPEKILQPWGARVDLHDALRQRTKEKYPEYLEDDEVARRFAFWGGVVVLLMAANRLVHMASITDLLAGFMMVGAALLLLPPVRARVFTATGESLTLATRGTLALCLFGLSAMV